MGFRPPEEPDDADRHLDARRLTPIRARPACSRRSTRSVPALQADGGDIVFSNIDDDGVVHVELVGACGTCPISTQTLKAGVERIIMDRVPGVTEVVAD